MAQHDPLWAQAMAGVEEHEELRRRHRADGRVTPEEDAHECGHLRLVVVHRIASAVEADDIAQAVRRGGPECWRAQRLIDQRRKRLANVIAFPGAGTDPQDGGPAAMAQAA